MQRKVKSRAWAYLGLALLLVLVLFVCVAIGSVRIPLSALVKTVFSPLVNALGELFSLPAWQDFGQDVPDTWRTILLRLRLPRVAVAMLAGVALSLAGATMQGLLKNPLADPYILGVSSGAAVGAAAAMLMGLSWNLLGAFAIPAAAFAGGIGSLVMVYSLSRGGGRSVLSMLLAGVAVSTFLGAVLSLLIFFSGQQLQQVVFWMMGGFSGRNWYHFLSILPFLAGGSLVIFWHSRELDALALGDEQAYYMGVDVERVRHRLLWASALLTASAVSVCGLIGFVGLVVPHAMRLIGGPVHRNLLPAAALAGGIFMAVADLLSRVVLAPTELPVGVITALVGGPFFLYLLKKRRVS
jgi:iron complex transport system permease protein